MLTAPRTRHERLGASPQAVLASARSAGDLGGFPLIVHADDFGETPEITEGICQAIQAGVITSTTVMANMPGTRHALERAPQLAALASFGVHLNLCEGSPLTFSPTLVDERGQFHRKRALFVRAVMGQLSLRELESEIAAQIARVRDAGVQLSHLDGHKHLHQLPIVSTAVANVLPRFGIERVRITRLGTLRQAGSASGFAREILARHAARVFSRARLRSPVRIVDLQSLMEKNASEGRIALERSGAVELCCHPGTRAADANKPGSHQRSQELAYLLSPAFRELLTVSGARLVSYWQV